MDNSETRTRSWTARFFARFAPAGGPSGSSASLSAPDPAKILFPASSQGPAGDAPLGVALSQSAADIVEREISIGRRADALGNALEARLEGEITLLTQGIRFLIALFWAAVAATLLWVSRGGEAPWAAWAAALTPAEAVILARPFIVVATAGFAAAFVLAAAVRLLGKADNKALRARSDELGRETGVLAREFDEELDRLRADMDGRKENPAAAVVDLSRAHLTALEAAVFFRRLQFLTDPDRGEAAAKFKGFLRRPAAAPSGRWENFLLGLMTGAFLFAIATSTPVRIPDELSAGLAQRHGWAASYIVYGAFAYAIAGLVIRVFAGVIVAGAERQARDEALDAVRSGFVATNAPRIESVIRRIEDALDVFQARLAGWRGKSDARAAEGSEGETPAWRRKPEGPQFVESAFTAAPKPFLADAPKPERRRKRKPFLPSPIPGAD